MMIHAHLLNLLPNTRTLRSALEISLHSARKLHFCDLGGSETEAGVAG